MKKLLVMVGLSALLMACSSGVKLDGPPVEDRMATQVESGTVGAGTGYGNNAGGVGVGQTGVAQVNLTDSANSMEGPVNVSKIIYFDYDSFQIRPEFAGTLEAHARWLNANRGRQAALEGHTDSSGGREYNLALGQKRADAVRRALLVLGVSDQQMEAVSFGKEKPADYGTSESAMAKNRRVEIFYH
jgi:peptidoglycan-associated lipoprotein